MKKNKIKSLEIDSFRAFSNKINLNFEANGSVADIVVIYAANGTGKTSTIEGVEWATTGAILRLDTIFSNNKDNKNPREGCILKNRQSEKNIGSVSIELDNGERIHRQTKPKSNQNNDYCEGVIIETVEDIQYFNRNILSQGSISKFSYEASSGTLFNSLLDTLESKNDLATYDKLNETHSRVDKSNSATIVEINFINGLISKENKEIDEIKSDYIDSSNLQESEHYILFKNNFSFYEDLSLKNNNEIISYIKESNTKLDSLKDKLIAFNIDDYRVDLKRNIISSKVIKLKENNIVRSNNLLKLECDLEEFISKKKEINRYLEKENINQINQMINSYRDYSQKIKKSNVYLIKAKRVKQKLLINTQTNSLLMLENKERKINKVVSCLLALFSNSNDINIIISEKNLFLKEINQEIQDKNNEMNSITRSSFIKINSNIDDVVLLNKRSLTLEELNIKIEDLISEKEKNVSFDEKLELIKTYATEVISEKQLSNCPACSHQYNDVNKLLESVNNVKNNSKSLVDGAILSLTELKNEYIYDIDRLTKNIDKRVLDKHIIIQDKIQLLTERNQKYIEVDSILNDLDIKYENIEVQQVLRELNLQQRAARDKYSTLNVLQQKYKFWFNKISTKINEEDNKQNQNNLDKKKITRSCIEQFGVDIEELIQISSSYHVLLFRDNKINSLVLNLKKDIEDINSVIKQGKDEVLFLCSKAGFDVDANINKIFEETIETKRVIKASYKYIQSSIKTYSISKNIEALDLVTDLQEVFSTYLSKIETSQVLLVKNETIDTHKSNLKNKTDTLKEGLKNIEKIKITLDDVMIYFSSLASESINNEVLNDMFMYIEPHLKYDEISFKVDLDGKNKRMYIQAKSSATKESNTPVYYLSEAQTNILSICIFLAKHARESDTGIDTIIIDDPVQSMDDLNSYALIDLCKIFARRFNKQIIITTHNRSFYNLFKDKLPESRYPTKFITL
jgi:DNA repair exonuclease SbcCD ATPase subunit